MINQNDIVVFDLETGGLDTNTCEPLQIAAIILDARTLAVKDEFQSYMQVTEPERVEAGALRVNKIKFENGVVYDANGGVAPPQKQVWESFTGFLKKYNPKGSHWSAPIPAGQNIRNYDLKITDRLCKKYNNVDKDGQQTIFNRRHVIDLLDLSFYWFENLPEPDKYNMDVLWTFFGIASEGSHNAIKDVKDTADVIVRFIKLHRNFGRSVKFKGACNA